MADDLKPCPFCNAEMQFDESGYEHPYSDTCPLDSLYIEDGHVAAWNRRAAPTAQEAAKVRVKAAIADQISEGIGAVLRKFCDSPDAAAARQYLHKMPESDWNTLIDMLAEESASAALRAIAGESHD